MEGEAGLSESNELCACYGVYLLMVREMARKNRMPRGPNASRNRLATAREAEAKRVGLTHSKKPFPELRGRGGRGRRMAWTIGSIERLENFRRETGRRGIREDLKRVRLWRRHLTALPPGTIGKHLRQLSAGYWRIPEGACERLMKLAENPRFSRKREPRLGDLAVLARLLGLRTKRALQLRAARPLKGRFLNHEMEAVK